MCWPLCVTSLWHDEWPNQTRNETPHIRLLLLHVCMCPCVCVCVCVCVCAQDLNQNHRRPGVSLGLLGLTRADNYQRPPTSWNQCAMRKSWKLQTNSGYLLFTPSYFPSSASAFNPNTPSWPPLIPLPVSRTWGTPDIIITISKPVSVLEAACAREKHTQDGVTLHQGGLLSVEDTQI